MDIKRGVPVVRPLIHSVSSSGGRIPLSIIRTSLASSSSSSSPSKTIRHVIPVVKTVSTGESSSSTTEAGGEDSSTPSSAESKTAVSTTTTTSVSWASGVRVSSSVSRLLSHKTGATATRLTPSSGPRTTFGSGRGLVNILRAGVDSQLGVQRSDRTGASVIQIRPSLGRSANIKVVKVDGTTSKDKDANSKSADKPSTTAPALIVRPNEANKTVTSGSSSTNEDGQQKMWNGDQQTNGNTANSIEKKNESDMHDSSSSKDTSSASVSSQPAVSRTSSHDIQSSEVKPTSSAAVSVYPTSSSSSFMSDMLLPNTQQQQLQQQQPMPGSFNDSFMGPGYPGMAPHQSHMYPGQHPMQQYPPMNPYGMPPAPYPWMPPNPMNPMWMQPSMSMPMNRQQQSYSSGSNFDILGEAPNFEHLGMDSSQSLTALLADSEPPPTFDSSSAFSRRSVSSHRNSPASAMMGGGGNAFMPSYPPGAGMMGGYPYNPYVPPMPYNPPGGYFPSQPVPSSSYGAPSGGYYPPGMHYPPMSTGMYSGSAGSSGAPYMPGMPGSMMPSSFGMPPNVGDMNPDYRMKNE